MHFYLSVSLLGFLLFLFSHILNFLVEAFCLFLGCVCVLKFLPQRLVFATLVPSVCFFTQVEALPVPGVTQFS